MGLKIDGIAASQAIDTSAESIDIEGLDISSLEAGDGTFNYEHRHPKDDGGSALDVLGAITYAKKIMSEDDCANDRERMYWNQVELPFVYIQGELFNDEEDDHVAAQAMAAAIQFYHRRKLPCTVRLSIDGHTLERDPKNPNVLKRSIARDVAITFKPANHSCRISQVDHIKDAKAELEKRTEADDPAFYNHSGTYRFPSVTFHMLPDENDPVEVIKSELETLSKALAAGNFNVAPGSLSGGAALQKEDVAKTPYFVNRVKAAFRDWNGTTDLREHMRKRVPDATDSFLEKFAELVDTIHLRKAMELDQHIHMLNKGALDSAVSKLPSFPEVKPDGDMDATKNVKRPSATPDMQDMKGTNVVPMKPTTPAKPKETNQQVADRHIAGMKADGLNVVPNEKGWNVNFQGHSDGYKAGTPQPAAPKAMSMMQSVVTKFLGPKKPIQSSSPEVDTMAQHKAIKDRHMSRMQDEGWNFSKDPSGNWSATPPMAKNEAPLVTVRGKYVEPTALSTSYFDDMTGKLYAPEGVFDVHIPGRDPQSAEAFQAVLGSPAITAFHDRAMAGWKMLNERLRDGTLPDQIVKIASWLMQKQIDVPDHLRQWVGSMNDLDLNQKFDEQPFNALKTAVMQHKADGKSILQSQDAANGGQIAISSRNARLGLNALGCGNVLFGDDNLLRSLFGLDHGQDQGTLKVIKKATASDGVWSDLERYYGKFHDSVAHTKGGALNEHLTVHPQDALFPSAMKHWLGIAAHDKALGLSEAPGFEAKPENPHTTLIKTEMLQDVLPYVNVLNSWFNKYGPMMSLLMYFGTLVPRILAETSQPMIQDPNGGIK
jgi:hypothetical protein